MPISIVSIYRNISIESYSRMNWFIEEQKVPTEDGSDGYTIKYDPNLNTFRRAMIVIVFTGMWLEETFHQEIVSRTGVDPGEKYDFKTYRDWLVLLKNIETELLDDIDTFMSARLTLMRRTNIDKDEIELAQKEADRAQKIMESISKALGIAIYS